MTGLQTRGVEPHFDLDRFRADVIVHLGTRGVTRTSLADRAGWRPEQLSRFLNGARINLDSVVQLAANCELSMDGYTAWKTLD